MNSIRCSQCKHYIEANAGEGKIYGCDRSKCVFEPTTKNDSSGLDKNSKKLEKGTTKNDCEHCSKTYGTLGCCDFVSNEPVYSCKEGHEEYARGIRKLGSTTKNNLGVEEVTALAEWTEKLTKECEEAYNKGYEDGMKAQAEPKTKIEESNFSREQYALDIDTAWKCGYEAGMKAQEPKTGHWISHREHCENLGIMMPNSIDVYEWCSNCDCGIDVREWYRSNYNYCPNCGAKMDRAESEE